MVYAKLLRSPLPHARIVVDRYVARARRIPACCLVLTGADLPIPYGILPVSQDEHALCVDKVRFVGDPVALVVARDELTAIEALDLFDVVYEPLTTIADPEEALATLEPRIHDYGDEGNVHKTGRAAVRRRRRGLRGAGPRLRGRRSSTKATRICRSSSTRPSRTRTATASWCVCLEHADAALPASRAREGAGHAGAHIRVIATPNGGGFGGKSDPFNHEIAVAKAALLLDRPVKITLTREEVFYCHRGRHPVMMKFRTGVKNDGTLTGGAPADDPRRRRVRLVRRREHLLYRRAADGDLPRAALQVSRAAACSRTRRRAGRSAGTARRRAGSARKSRSTRLPSALGIDPADFRLRIVEQPNTLTANYLRVSTIGLAECIRRVVGRSDWRQRYRKLGRRTRVRSRLLVLPVRRRAADLLERHAALGRAAEARSQRRRHGVLRRGGDRPGIGRRAGRVRGGGARHRAVRHPGGHRRHGSHARRSRLVLEPRDADDGQRGDSGRRRARGTCSRTPSSRKLGVPQRTGSSSPNGAYSTPRIPIGGMSFRDAVCTAEAMFGAIGTVGSYTPPQERREIQRWRRRAVPDLLLHRRRRRGRGGRIDGLGCRAARLDCARYRPRAQSDARARAGRRQRLHGARRSADGRAGVPPAAAAPLARARPQVSVDARVQEPDVARHARGVHGSRRESGSERAVRREGSRSGSAAADHAGGRQRRVRRDRRPHRRSADHAGEDREGAGRQSRRQARAIRPARRSRPSPGRKRFRCRRRGKAATGGLRPRVSFYRIQKNDTRGP